MRIRGPFTLAVAALGALLVPLGSRADEPSGDEGDSYWESHFGLRLQVTHNSYQDVQIRERRVNRNGLGLSFAQPTVVAENVAEEKSWRQTAEMLELVYDPFGKECRAFGMYLGLGATETSLDVGTERVSLGTESIYTLGLMGSLGHISKVFRFDWELQGTRTDGESTNVNQFPGFDESVQITAYNYGGRLTAAINLYPETGPDPDGIVFEPYLGVLYYHLQQEELFVVGSGPTRSSFEFDVESATRSDVRGIVGLRLVGLEGQSDVSMEGSYGSESFGIGLIVDIRF